MLQRFKIFSDSEIVLAATDAYSYTNRHYIVRGKINQQGYLEFAFPSKPNRTYYVKESIYYQLIADERK